MSERVSTAGMYLCYAVEEEKGARPVTGYKVIPEIKSMPSFNPAPNTIDSTTLLETEWMTYVEGLKDPGGALEYGANLTDDLEQIWGDLMTAYDTAAKAGNAVWFAVVHPRLTNCRYFTGKPAAIGINEAEVNGMAETTLYITPTGAIEKGTKPELDEESKKLVGVVPISMRSVSPPVAAVPSRKNSVEV